MTNRKAGENLPEQRCQIILFKAPGFQHKNWKTYKETRMPGPLHGKVLRKPKHWSYYTKTLNQLF